MDDSERSIANKKRSNKFQIYHIIDFNNFGRNYFIRHRISLEYDRMSKEFWIPRMKNQSVCQRLYSNDTVSFQQTSLASERPCFVVKEDVSAFKQRINLMIRHKIFRSSCL